MEKFTNQKKNSTHDFVKYFFPENKQIAYPAWIILDENYKILFRYEGLIKPKQLIEILRKSSQKQ